MGNSYFLGPIWYPSELSDVPYSPNQFFGWALNSQVDIFTFLNNIDRRFITIIFTWLFDCDCFWKIFNRILIWFFPLFQLLEHSHPLGHNNLHQCPGPKPTTRPRHLSKQVLLRLLLKVLRPRPQELDRNMMLPTQ